MSWVLIFRTSLSKSVCVPRGREDMKRHNSSVLGFHNPPSLLFPRAQAACAESTWKGELGAGRGELWTPARGGCVLPTAPSPSPTPSGGFTFRVLHWMWYHHTHGDNSVYFLLTVLRTKGESSESKVKEDEMTYFLGYFCADEKLILIKPTLKSFQPTFSQGHTLLDKQG